jgi:DNA-binding transcriptional ArsR family regulator
MEPEVFVASLRALGNRTRLAIVSALMEADYCNHELSADLGLSLSLTSHHLNVLRKNGLVEVEQDLNDGRCFHYSLCQDTMEDLRATFNQLIGPRRSGD